MTVAPDDQAPSPRRLLVFTDVGEEVDDEGALWMMCKVLEASPQGYEADVVFVTGRPKERAMRWARLLSSVELPLTAGNRVQYYLGPDTARHMRYHETVDEDLLLRAGVQPLTPFTGSSTGYDIVLQLSPLGGFHEPEEESDGPLANVKPRDGAELALYLLVGAEDSTNFPSHEKPHRAFKKHLEDHGFVFRKVTAPNYANWSASTLELFPSGLRDLVIKDEWNKAIGRIPPANATLLVRFRVNTGVSFAIVSKAYRNFCATYESDPAFQGAAEWWNGLATAMSSKIQDRYISISRANDDNGAKYGNPAANEKIRHKDQTWESLLCADCVDEILQRFGAAILEESGESQPEAVLATKKELAACSIDSIMGWALSVLTEYLGRMYVFAVHKCNDSVAKETFEAYLTSETPLDFSTFPAFPPACSELVFELQKHFVGNPQYDPSGMLIALAAMAADKQELLSLAGKLEEGTSLLDVSSRGKAMAAAYRGEDPSSLLSRLGV